MKTAKKMKQSKAPMTRVGNEKSKGLKAEKGKSQVKKDYSVTKYTNSDNARKL